MNNQFGIYDKSFNLIIDAIKDYSQIQRAVIFGSRAMGNYKKGSDIDIAILGDKVDFGVISSLHTKLNETLPIPYEVDIIDFNVLNTQELKDNILQFGKEIYSKK